MENMKKYMIFESLTQESIRNLGVGTIPMLSKEFVEKRKKEESVDFSKMAIGDMSLPCGIDSIGLEFWDLDHNCTTDNPFSKDLEIAISSVLEQYNIPSKEGMEYIDLNKILLSQRLKAPLGLYLMQSTPTEDRFFREYAVNTILVTSRVPKSEPKIDWDSECINFRTDGYIYHNPRFLNMHISNSDEIKNKYNSIQMGKGLSIKPVGTITKTVPYSMFAPQMDIRDFSDKKFPRFVSVDKLLSKTEADTDIPF